MTFCDLCDRWTPKTPDFEVCQKRLSFHNCISSLIRLNPTHLPARSVLVNGCLQQLISWRTNSQPSIWITILLCNCSDRIRNEYCFCIKLGIAWWTNYKGIKLNKNVTLIEILQGKCRNPSTRIIWFDILKGGMDRMGCLTQWWIVCFNGLSQGTLAY